MNEFKELEKARRGTFDVVSGYNEHTQYHLAFDVLIYFFFWVHMLKVAPASLTSRSTTSLAQHTQGKLL